VVAENTRALRGFLRWGHEEGYFSAVQAELLPHNAAKVKPARKCTAAPVRRRKGRRVEESETYIRDEDAPSALQVVRLGEELAKAFPAWAGSLLSSPPAAACARASSSSSRRTTATSMRSTSVGRVASARSSP
jgi:hypothetical protein